MNKRESETAEDFSLPVGPLLPSCPMLTTELTLSSFYAVCMVMAAYYSVRTQILCFWPYVSDEALG